MLTSVAGLEALANVGGSLRIATDPSNGFAWLDCGDCGVPFACKGRAFCPACIGRRMVESLP